MQKKISWILTFFFLFNFSCKSVNSRTKNSHQSSPKSIDVNCQKESQQYTGKDLSKENIYTTCIELSQGKYFDGNYAINYQPAVDFDNANEQSAFALQLPDIINIKKNIARSIVQLAQKIPDFGDLSKKSHGFGFGLSLSALHYYASGAEFLILGQESDFNKKTLAMFGYWGAANFSTESLGATLQLLKASTSCKAVNDYKGSFINIGGGFAIPPAKIVFGVGIGADFMKIISQFKLPQLDNFREGIIHIAKQLPLDLKNKREKSFASVALYQISLRFLRVIARVLPEDMQEYISEEIEKSNDAIQAMYKENGEIKLVLQSFMESEYSKDFISKVFKTIIIHVENAINVSGIMFPELHKTLKNLNETLTGCNALSLGIGASATVSPIALSFGHTYYHHFDWASINLDKLNKILDKEAFIAMLTQRGDLNLSDSDNEFHRNLLFLTGIKYPPNFNLKFEEKGEDFILE